MPHPFIWQDSSINESMLYEPLVKKLESAIGPIAVHLVDTMSCVSVQSGLRYATWQQALIFVCDGFTPATRQAVQIVFGSGPSRNVIAVYRLHCSLAHTALDPDC